MKRASPQAIATVLAGAATALLAIPAVRGALEADMARHMLIEFPLALGIGAVAAGFAPRARAAFARIDRLGFTGWLFASLVLAYWMIPSALDAALASPAMNAAKLASLGLAGFALRASASRSPVALEAFFVGNFAWMSATVGLIYQEADAQLCLNYLADGQQRAGRGLVVLSVACAISWLGARRRRFVESHQRVPQPADLR
jgi:hypothetical protein